MTNVTDKVRAALVLAIEHAPNEYWKEQYRQLVSELDGMVMIESDKLAKIRDDLEYVMRNNDGLPVKSIGRGRESLELIAPYVKGDSDCGCTEYGQKVICARTDANGIRGQHCRNEKKE